MRRARDAPPATLIDDGNGGGRIARRGEVGHEVWDRCRIHPVAGGGRQSPGFVARVYSFNGDAPGAAGLPHNAVAAASPARRWGTRWRREVATLGQALVAQGWEADRRYAHEDPPQMFRRRVP